MRQHRTHAKIPKEYYRKNHKICLFLRTANHSRTRCMDLDWLCVIYETVGAADDLFLLILIIVFQTKVGVGIGLGGTTEADNPQDPVVEMQKVWQTFPQLLLAQLVQHVSTTNYWLPVVSTEPIRIHPVIMSLPSHSQCPGDWRVQCPTNSSHKHVETERCQNGAV